MKKKKEFFSNVAGQYSKALMEDVLPFWMRYSVDKEFGGYFTCLDRKGKVYDTDKFVWLQGRQIWTYAMMYNRVSRNPEWLEVARQGIYFLKKYGRDSRGNFYFSLDRAGIPLVQAYNIYSDCFAALAFYEYSKATGDQSCHTIAMQAYENFLLRLDHPKGQYEKSTGHRPMKSFGLPMMTAYLTTELAADIDSVQLRAVLERCVYQIKEQHYDAKLGVMREFTDLDGHYLDTFEGRLINPGHGIEAMWFLMDVAERLQEFALVDWATDVCLNILKYSWDEKHGGIFYFMDAKGAPPQQLEWDQKLWWVHIEALIALSKAYVHDQRADVWAWYERVHEYTWSHFPDSAYGEWYGYLNRQGDPLLQLKGGKWKGCFHVPRGLYECWSNFKTLANNTPK